MWPVLLLNNGSNCCLLACTEIIINYKAFSDALSLSCHCLTVKCPLLIFSFRINNCNLTQTQCGDLAKALESNSSSPLKELELRGNYSVSGWNIFSYFIGNPNSKLILRWVSGNILHCTILCFMLPPISGEGVKFACFSSVQDSHYGIILTSSFSSVSFFMYKGHFKGFSGITISKNTK